MKRLLICEVAVCSSLLLFTAGCEKKAGAQDNGAGLVPSPVQTDFDPNNFKVDHPEQFALATVGEHDAAPELNVTGVVSPDVSRQVPVPSLANGRIAGIYARLGDAVKKGQLLFKVHSADISGAFSNYLQAVKNEELTKIQLDRANLLFAHGAIPKSGVEIAQNAEEDNLVLLTAAQEQLGVLGVDPKHPSATVEVHAPVSGTITDQEITDQSGVQALASPTPLTISDLTHVWIICDVYENNLAQVRLGEFADVRLNAYPDTLLKGRIGNIGPVLDPNIRTAKVRLESPNPGYMHLGMFATATFHGTKMQVYSTVPATAILHLHDRQWVYLKRDDGSFNRTEVAAGNMLPGNIQEVTKGLNPGEKVIVDALDLQNTVSQ